MTLEEEAIQLVLSGSRKGVTGEKLNEIHKAVIGGRPDKWYCSTCNGKLDAVFTDLRLKYYHLIPKKMSKSTKYTISKEAKKNNVGTVVLINGERTEAIDLNNMTDAQAERILKSPYAHNIEKVATKDSEETETKATKTTTTTSKK